VIRDHIKNRVCFSEARRSAAEEKLNTEEREREREM
jgi:hypothetical protein